jgi:hypothetical protein
MKSNLEEIFEKNVGYSGGRMKSLVRSKKGNNVYAKLRPLSIITEWPG